MNKKLLVSFALASLTGISTQAKEKMSSETTQQRPNIILFMVDDMGWQDTSLPFWTQKTHYNEAYETPNMERLAKKGMMFTQAYACNISSATRCSLITGANNTRHRVTNWTLEKNKATDRPCRAFRLSSRLSFLPSSQTVREKLFFPPFGYTYEESEDSS